MDTPPPCPECQSEFAYPDSTLFVCPDCNHEWHPSEAASAEAADTNGGITDAYGTPLADGDNITVIKDLKVKGASSVLKVGTKVKGIRLIDGDHDIACKIDGFGAMNLKSEFVKKA